MGTDRVATRLRAWLSEYGGFAAWYIAISGSFVILARFESDVSWQRAFLIGALVAAGPFLAAFAVIAFIHLVGRALVVCGFIARVWRWVWR